MLVIDLGSKISTWRIQKQSLWGREGLLLDLLMSDLAEIKSDLVVILVVGGSLANEKNDTCDRRNIFGTYKNTNKNYNPNII